MFSGWKCTTIENPAFMAVIYPQFRCAGANCTPNGQGVMCRVTVLGWHTRQVLIARPLNSVKTEAGVAMPKAAAREDTDAVA